MNAIRKLIENAPAPRSPGATFKLLAEHFPPAPVESASHHALAKAALGVLLDVSRAPGLTASQRRQVANFIRVWSMLIEEYERSHFEVGRVSGVDALKYLMTQHGLDQGGLRKEIGPQPVVSRILRGERHLTAEHIARLAKRFGVSPAVFFDEAG